MSDKTTEHLEALIAGEATLDAHELRADFPIFRQRFHGKPLAYLLYTIPEEIDRLVEGLDNVNKTLGNGASPTLVGVGKRGARG